MGSHGSVLVVGHADLAAGLDAALDSRSVVTRATTGDAVDYLNANAETIHAIISDHDPPTVDCYQLLAAGASTPVVVAVRDGSSKLATDAHRQGAATYLDLATVDDEDTVLSSITEAQIGPQQAEAGADDTATGRGSTAQLDANRDHVEEFVSIISHELRTPVQKANSGLDLIAADCDSKYIDDVRDTLERMEELLDELISIVKYGDTVEETTAIDLDTVVEETWPNAPNATLDVESSLPTVEAEPSRLRQVFENLFRNAVEHSSGTIRVRVGVIDHHGRGRGDDQIGLYVSDDGSGISPEKREQVFEYGYTGSRDGTGLGLAIVDRIVEAFGWDISITESNEGGARFEIRNITLA